MTVADNTQPRPHVVTQTASLWEHRQVQTSRFKPPNEVAGNAFACNWKQVGKNAPKVIERFVSKPNMIGLHFPAAFLTASSM